MDGHIYMGSDQAILVTSAVWTTTWPPTPGAKPDLPASRHHPYQFGIDGSFTRDLGTVKNIFNTWYAYD